VYFTQNRNNNFSFLQHKKTGSKRSGGTPSVVVVVVVVAESSGVAAHIHRHRHAQTHRFVEFVCAGTIIKYQLSTVVWAILHYG
jgi:hypothetical protein